MARASADCDPQLEPQGGGAGRDRLPGDVGSLGRRPEHVDEPDRPGNVRQGTVDALAENLAAARIDRDDAPAMPLHPGRNRVRCLDGTGTGPDHGDGVITGQDPLDNGVQVGHPATVPVMTGGASGPPGQSASPGDCSRPAWPRSRQAGGPARCTAGPAAPATGSTAVAPVPSAAVAAGGGLASGRLRGRRRGSCRAERAATLVAVLAAGKISTRFLVQDEEFVRGLIHAYGHHGEALDVLLLALRSSAVVVF